MEDRKTLEERTKDEGRVRFGDMVDDFDHNRPRPDPQREAPTHPYF